MTKRRALTGFGAGLIVILAFAIYFYFNFTTVIVSGVSMEDTFHDGDRLLASKAYWLVGGVHKRDVVVIKTDDDRGYLIKRVLAMGGELVDWANMPESHRLGDGEYRVPEGHIYVVGDNREHSEDSRKFGPVPVDRILGKVVWRR